MALTVQEFVSDRGVKLLVHFTKMSNLESILQRGLLTRDVLIAEGNLAALNDPCRHDPINAVSVSIGFPNDAVFAEFREDDQDADWVIVAISPRVLWQVPCAFYMAQACMAQASTVPFEQRTTLDALRDMYRDVDGLTRAELSLPDDLPTDPQAEVLVMEDIPTRDILAIFVRDGTTKAKVEALCPRLNVRVQPYLFGRRPDWLARGNGLAEKMRAAAEIP